MLIFIINGSDLQVKAEYMCDIISHSQSLSFCPSAIFRNTHSLVYKLNYYLWSTNDFFEDQNETQVGLGSMSPLEEIILGAYPLTIHYMYSSTFNLIIALS